ncbi:NUMOD1 domain-containing DNA-binding protein [Phaeobacter gallaeciensis]|uniref:NUMOD1 domain-containing DNA-binding protein n=1 Tax=Phaeobacter gallaeciensis TaxID=60890 RepID=UPI002380B3FC|nr:NUMOD1 domain-containing DNA-binding protein [Phaeobacter gallaeciensis]MDE4272972.1 NUMOD1 domain-containing DNA-binding protein [Phaeobacter gallaeciensis]MDE4298075.1 NUMOD1 domain-containing DNA-binding protein [Phaeobacter gallaeciensis]MDE5183263.1 NUMOD1 domain-containing DNA-binding protein [Phaeobacter gallaeciensis]
MAKPKYRDITIRGVTYPDAKTAAAALGLSVSRVRSALRTDTLNSLGRRSRLCPVTIRGVTYESFSKAAQELGVSANTVRAAARNGTLHRVGTGRVGVEPMPVLIAGLRFESAQAAADHFKVKVMTVYSAISDGDPDRIARPPRYNPARSRRIKIGSLTFPSMAQAARELGFKDREFVSKALKNGSKRGRQRILAAAMRLAHQRQSGVTGGGDGI